MSVRHERSVQSDWPANGVKRPREARYRGGTAIRYWCDNETSESVGSINVMLVIHEAFVYVGCGKRLRESWDHYEIFGIVPV